MSNDIKSRLPEIIERHAKWLRREVGGARADLRNADLRNADLRRADLRGANLRSADLSDTRADLIAEILKLPAELDALSVTIIEGRIDGSTYSGECSCLAGTLAVAHGDDSYKGGIIASGDLIFLGNPNSPRERWFQGIKPEDTPENSQISAITLEWVREAIAIRDNILQVCGSKRNAVS